MFLVQDQHGTKEGVYICLIIYLQTRHLLWEVTISCNYKDLIHGQKIQLPSSVSRIFGHLITTKLGNIVRQEKNSSVTSKERNDYMERFEVQLFTNLVENASSYHPKAIIIN